MADGSSMSCAWYIPAQLAGLAGMPTTERGIHKLAEREGWARRPRQRGKGWEYPERALPVRTRDAIQRRSAIEVAQNASPAFQQGSNLARRLLITDSIDAAAQQRIREVGQASAAGLTGKPKQRMEAKLELLARLTTFAQSRGLKLCAAMEDFCSAYNSGELTVPVAVRYHTGADLHPATLRRWRSINKKQGPAALAGSYGNRGGTGTIDSQPELRDFAIGLIADKPHIDATALHAALETRFSGHRIPSERSVQRWLGKWKKDNAEMLTAVANPDAWKNRYKVAFGNLDDGVVRANQVWQLDSTPGDIQLVDGRYNIIGAIDIATRRIKLHVAKTSSADAVCSLIRRAILDWGVPEAVKIDNGRDYASQRVQRALQGLEIEARFSAPFSPWEKGNIERAFRTFSHSLLELLPGFSGHNVAEAQGLRAGESFADRMFKKNASTILKLSAAELQQFCDRWCDDLYAHDVHAGLRGETPFQRAASLRDAIRRVQDVRALDLLLAEAPDGNGMRTVSKKGIKLDRAWYIASELHSLVRQSVQVLYDEADAGRVVVYHDGAFVCVAECPELIGVSRKEIATEARLRQNANISEKRRELKALKRKANTGDIAWEILDRKREQAAQLSAFPAPNVVHMTPALEAAAEAAGALDAPAVVVETSPCTIEHVDGAARVQQREFAQDETAEERFARALGYLMTPEEDRNDIQRGFLRRHLTSSEFNGRWSLFEYFGPEQLGLPLDYAALLPDGTCRDRLLQAQQGE